MKLSEITTLLKKNGFVKLNAEDVLDNKVKSINKSYFKYKGNLHIYINENLGYEIVAKGQDIGLGRYITSFIDEDGFANQTGTYTPELFFPNFIKNITNA